MIGNRSELVSQSVQDAREGGLPGTFVGFTFDSKRDEIEDLLWRVGVHVGVVGFDAERKSVKVTGRYSSYIVAKAELNKLGFEVHFHKLPSAPETM